MKKLSLSVIRCFVCVYQVFARKIKEKTKKTTWKIQGKNSATIWFSCQKFKFFAHLSFLTLSWHKSTKKSRLSKMRLNPWCCNQCVTSTIKRISLCFLFFVFCNVCDLNRWYNITEMKVCYDMVRESHTNICIGSTGVLTAKSYLDLLSGRYHRCPSRWCMN